MFTKFDKPLVFTTVKGDDADAFICMMNELREQGTEGFLLRLEYLLPENRIWPGQIDARRVVSACSGGGISGIFDEPRQGGVILFRHQEEPSAVFPGEDRTAFFQ